MNIRNTTTKLVTLAIVVAAIAAVGAHRTAGQATNPTGHYHCIIGFAPGQTLRFSLFNPKEQGSEPVRASAYIYDSTGRLITKTEETAIAPGQFHSFDFNRDMLSTGGEPGTGRLQVRGVIQVSFSDGSVRTVRASFPVSIEVIDNTSGQTTGGDYYTGSVTVSGDG